MSDIGHSVENVAHLKVGKHSVILWIALIAGAYVAYKYWSNAQAASNAAASTDTTSTDTTNSGTSSTDGLPVDGTGLSPAGTTPIISVTVTPTNSSAGVAGAPTANNPSQIASGYLLSLLTHGNATQQNAAKNAYVQIGQYKTAKTALAHVKAALAKVPNTKQNAAERQKLSREEGVLQTIVNHGG